MKQTYLPFFGDSTVSPIHPLGDHTRGPVPGVQTVQSSMNGPLVSVINGRLLAIRSNGNQHSFFMCFCGQVRSLTLLNLPSGLPHVFLRCHFFNERIKGSLKGSLHATQLLGIKLDAKGCWEDLGERDFLPKKWGWGGRCLGWWHRTLNFFGWGVWVGWSNIISESGGPP